MKKHEKRLGLLLLVQSIILIAVLFTAIKQDHRFKKEIIDLKNQRDSIAFEYQDFKKFSTMEMGD